MGKAVEKKKSKKAPSAKEDKPKNYQRRIFKGNNARVLLQRRGALVAGEKTMNALDLISRIFVTEVGRKSELLAHANKCKTIKSDFALFTVDKRMNMNLVAYVPKVGQHALKSKEKKEKKEKVK